MLIHYFAACIIFLTVLWLFSLNVHSDYFHGKECWVSKIYNSEYIVTRKKCSKMNDGYNLCSYQELTPSITFSLEEKDGKYEYNYHIHGKLVLNYLSVVNEKNGQEIVIMENRFTDSMTNGKLNIKEDLIPFLKIKANIDGKIFEEKLVKTRRPLNRDGL